MFCLKCSTLKHNFVQGPQDYLDWEMQWLMMSAWATSTKKALSTEYKAFKAFCRLDNIDRLPVSGYQLARYATWLLSSGRLKSTGSLQQYLSAVRTLHRRIGLDCPTPKSYGPLDMVVRGSRRAAQRPIHRTLPVTPKILKFILATKPKNPMCATEYKLLTIFKAVALIYFLSMLRSSNLLPISRKNIDLVQVLTWGDISRVKHGVVLSIRKTKTIQHRQRVQTVPLPASPDPNWCPVRTLDALATIYGHDTCRANTPVFRIPSKSEKSWITLEKAQFDSFFKKRLEAAGLDPLDYTLHGFRHGSIQTAMLVEDSMALVAVTSDHSSDAINAYTGIPATNRMRVCAKMVHHLNSV